MDEHELKQYILHGQHITDPRDPITVTSNLCGIQAQMMSCALHALRIRTGGELSCADRENLVKTWSIRGTLHIFPEKDMPVFLYEGHKRSYRAVDMLCGDDYITLERKQFFADRIVGLVKQGIRERSALKGECEKLGMTDTESKSVFDQWGGTIYHLFKKGILCYEPQQKREMRLCKAELTPLGADAARLEMLKRYFMSFAPATIKDASYYLGITQANIKLLVNKLPIESINAAGRECLYIKRPNMPKSLPEIPKCVLLAGFDGTMLGYDKAQNPFLPKEYMRGIFNLTGMVFPAILLNGKVVGKWRRGTRNLTFTLFETIAARDRDAILFAASELWGNNTGKVLWEVNSG